MILACFHLMGDNRLMSAGLPMNDSLLAMVACRCIALLSGRGDLCVAATALCLGAPRACTRRSTVAVPASP